METDVFLDNLPDTANMILNVLWNRNCEMTVSELADTVNEIYHTSWDETHIKNFAKLLVTSDYVEKKHHGFKTYYVALGADFEMDGYEG